MDVYFQIKHGYFFLSLGSFTGMYHYSFFQYFPIPFTPCVKQTMTFLMPMNSLVICLLLLATLFY